MRNREWNLNGIWVRSLPLEDHDEAEFTKEEKKQLSKTKQDFSQMVPKPLGPAQSQQLVDVIKAQGV